MRISWLEPAAAPCTPSDLEAAGVLSRHLSVDPARYEPELSALRAARGYVARDEVCLAPDTPDLDRILARFLAEHHHAEDEVRFVLSGAGIFDIRSLDDRFVRIEVGPGDLLVVPARRHHRFLLTDERRIRCVRLFRDPAGWVPVYRAP